MTRVAITDAALTPVAAVISPGSSVEWTNKGSKEHRVKSTQGTFSAFTLQPGKSKTVKFDRRGCERYEVDDRLNGRVLVGVLSCPGAASHPPPRWRRWRREHAASEGWRGNSPLQRQDDRLGRRGP